MLFTETLEGAENMHDSEHLSPFTEQERVRQLPQLSAEEAFSPSSNATFDPQDHEDVLEENVNSPAGEQNGMKVPQQRLAETTSNAVNKVEPVTFKVDVFHTQPVCELLVGLEFDTKEAAYTFYRDYACSVGFGITIKASRRSKKSGKFIDVKIVCSRFGSNREPETFLNPRPCSKTDCRAGMHIKRRENGNWVIHNFVKEHNHEIYPADLLHSPKGSKKGIVASCRNKGLELGLDEEGVETLLEKLMCLQNENPNFFYSIDLDHEKRVTSVLWVDPNGRRDYWSFCDVVFFDTFYTSNNYSIPLVPIVGVNNNNQYTLFGTALVGSDKASTYIWVMQTWLKSMGGRSPRVILTDLDKPLKEAVAAVFPETRHCVCLWHVLGRIPGHVISKHENFVEKLNSCIYCSLTEEELEVQWRDLVDKFELGEDEWVRLLYEDRRKWVPMYMHDDSLAGMSTAERSGSITSFLDKYVCRENTVEDFIENYKLYLQERYELDEADEPQTTTTQEKQPSAQEKSLSPLMIQMSALYTDAVLEQFQHEVSGVVCCHMQKESENEASVRFRVEESGLKNFTVVWNEKQVKICCTCQSFEYRGFLCRHALLVIQTSGISNIPPHYILKRWTKNAKIREIISQEESTGIRCRQERFNELCKKAIQLGLEASLSQDGHDIAFQALERVLRQCVGVNNSIPSSLAIHGSVGAREKNRMLGKSSKKRKEHLQPPGGSTEFLDASYNKNMKVKAPPDDGRNHLLVPGLDNPPPAEEEDEEEI